MQELKNSYEFNEERFKVVFYRKLIQNVTVNKMEEIVISLVITHSDLIMNN